MHSSDELDGGKKSRGLISSNCAAYTEESGIHPAAPKKRGGRVRDEHKRRLIHQAMDEGIRATKNIQFYVAEKLKTGKERVSRKMISEVRKAR